MLARRQLATPPEQPLGTARAGWEETAFLPSRCGLGSWRGAPGGRVCSLHAHLHPWDALYPVSAWGCLLRNMPTAGPSSGH